MIQPSGACTSHVRLAFFGQLAHIAHMSHPSLCLHPPLPAPSLPCTSFAFTLACLLQPCPIPQSYAVQDGTKITPAEYMSALVSGHLLSRLEALGVDTTALSPATLQLVITVPAYFEQEQRTEFRQAVIDAGIPEACVIRVIGEPTAAGFAVWFSLPKEQRSNTMLVVDMGAGTFDITCMDFSETQAAGAERPTLTVQPVAVGGDTRLGGSDLTTLLADLALFKLRAKGVPLPATLSAANLKLRADIETLKHDLCLCKTQVTYSHPSSDTEITITYDEYVEMSIPITDRLQRLVKGIIQQIGGGRGKHVILAMVGGACLDQNVQRVLVKACEDSGLTITAVRPKFFSGWIHRTFFYRGGLCFVLLCLQFHPVLQLSGVCQCTILSQAF